MVRGAISGYCAEVGVTHGRWLGQIDAVAAATSKATLGLAISNNPMVINTTIYKESVVAID